MNSSSDSVNESQAESTSSSRTFSPGMYYFGHQSESESEYSSRSSCSDVDRILDEELANISQLLLNGCKKTFTEHLDTNKYIEFLCEHISSLLETQNTETTADLYLQMLNEMRAKKEKEKKQYRWNSLRGIRRVKRRRGLVSHCFQNEV